MTARTPKSKTLADLSDRDMGRHLTVYDSAGDVAIEGRLDGVVPSGGRVELVLTLGRSPGMRVHCVPLPAATRCQTTTGEGR